MFTLTCFLLVWSNFVVNAKINHIIGGDNAEKCEFPHIAFVYVRKSSGGIACGGSLIDASHVVTAAHCLKGDVKKLFAFFGSLNSRKMKSFIKVSNYSMHEEYEIVNETVVNDIAVLTLVHPVNLDECVKPIRLAVSGEEFVGNCTVAGWGKTESSNSSNYLMRADVALLSKDNCSQHAPNIQDQHICAGDASLNGKTTCKGDSGGPLTCRSAFDGNDVLVGVTSYGWTCTEGLSIFAKVSYFKDWINQHTI